MGRVQNVLRSSWPEKRKTIVVNSVQVKIVAPARLENRDDPDVSYAYPLFSVVSGGSVEEMEAAERRGREKAIFTAVAIPDEMQVLGPWTMVISGLDGGKLDVVVDPDDGEARGQLVIPKGLLREDEVLDVWFDGDRMVVQYEWDCGDGRTLRKHEEVPVSSNFRLLDWLGAAREKVRKADELCAEIAALGVGMEEE